jgi:GNAT superfamily N-acetyltransferase
MCNPENMKLRFKLPFEEKPGIIEWLLNQSYAELIDVEPDDWEAEKENWKQSDRGVFENPDTIGACTRLSYYNNDLVGFFCFDPRPKPEYGIIGHNCVLPKFRRHGFGMQQIREILQLLKVSGIRQCRVSTCDHWFFIPAQRMYTACGFIEEKRIPRNRDHNQDMIHYYFNIS